MQSLIQRIDKQGAQMSEMDNKQQQRMDAQCQQLLEIAQRGFALERQQQQHQAQIQELHQVQQVLSAAASESVWERETLMDAFHMNQAQECLVISRPIKQQQQQQQQQQQSFTKEQAAAELGVDVAVIEQPKYLQSGYRARLGVQAANKKLAAIREASAAKDVPPMTPGGFVVRRERTKLGADRARTLRPLEQALQRELAQGQWGFILYQGANYCNLLLTHGPVKDAQRGAVPAFRYPVEQHLLRKQTLHSGQGGFDVDPKHAVLVNMEPTTIQRTLHQILGPPAAAAAAAAAAPPAAAAPAHPPPSEVPTDIYMHQRVAGVARAHESSGGVDTPPPKRGGPASYTEAVSARPPSPPAAPAPPPSAPPPPSSAGGSGTSSPRHANPGSASGSHGAASGGSGPPSPRHAKPGSASGSLGAASGGYGAGRGGAGRARDNTSNNNASRGAGGMSGNKNGSSMK